MIESTVKAFKIINLLAESDKGLSLAEMRKAVGFNKTTTFHHLSTLESLQVVEKKENLYSLGILLFELGNKVKVRKLLIDRSHPILKKLCEEVNETTNLAQIHNNEVLYLDKIESKRSLQIQTSIGHREPLNCTALGKCALSLFSEKKIKKIVSEIRLEKRTPNTTTNKKEFLTEIKKIKETGFSVDDQELEHGLRCVSVPLHLDEYNFYGAISLSGPAERFSDETIREYVKLLIKARNKIMKV